MRDFFSCSVSTSQSINVKLLLPFVAVPKLGTVWDWTIGFIVMVMLFILVQWARQTQDGKKKIVRGLD